MAELSCEQCDELTAELALGVLGGRERAEALAHLSRCARCQDSVSAMTATVGRLVELLPEADPPPGFDQRVIAAMTPPGFEHPAITSPKAAARRAHRGVPVAAAVLTGALLAGGGWLFGALFPVDPAGLPISGVQVQPTADVMVSPLLAGDQEIGQAYVYAQAPSWIFLSISDPAKSGSIGASTTLTCELTNQDGSSVALGSFSLQDGHADWATQTPIDARSFDGAKLTTDTGVTLASARFSPQDASPDTTSDAGKHRDDSDSGNDHSGDSHDKDSDGKSSHDKDSDGKSSDGKDSDGKSSDGKDSDGKSSDGKDSDGKSSHGKDSDDKGSHGKDSHHKGSNGKDSHHKDSHDKDSHDKDSGDKDSGDKDSQGK